MRVRTQGYRLEGEAACREDEVGCMLTGNSDVVGEDQDMEVQANAGTGWKWPLDVIGEVSGRPEVGKNEDATLALVGVF